MAENEVEKQAIKPDDAVPDSAAESAEGLPATVAPASEAENADGPKKVSSSAEASKDKPSKPKGEAKNNSKATGKPKSKKATKTGSKQEPKADKPSLADRHLALPAVIAIVALAAVIAGVIGFNLANAASAKSTTAVFAEDALDDVVATYTYKGERHDITAREAIESQYGVSQSQLSDGNYTAPSTELIVRYVRNKVLVQAAEEQGVVPSDEELAAYARDTLGNEDFETIANMYGVSTDQAKDIVYTSCTVNLLSKKINDDATAEVPTPPTEPAEGEEDKATEEYGNYIAGILGDNWDTEKDDWANTDNDYYQMLAGREITTGEATYAQASAVYDVAFSIYSAETGASRLSWNNYMNKLFEDVTLDCYGLYL